MLSLIIYCQWTSINSYYEKNLASGTVRCIDSEIPFDIPNGWEWCRLTRLTQFITDGDHQAPPKTDRGIPFVVISDISKGQNEICTTRFVPQSYFDSLPQERKPQKGDILFSVTGSYGIAIENNFDSIFCFQRHIALIRPQTWGKYLCLVLQSDFVKTQCDETATGMAQKTVGLESLRNFLIPVPPLTEQYRIVVKLNSIFPLVEKYNSYQEQAQACNSTIINLLKKSILQEAIQGKLVPQIESEGTAEDLLVEIRAEKQRLVKEGKLKKSAIANESRIFRGDDNRYYEQIGSETLQIEGELDFPASWSIVRLSSVCSLLDGDKKDGQFICMDAKYLRGKSSGEYLSKGRFVSKGQNIILVDGENSGEIFIVPHDGYMGSTFKQLWISGKLHVPYILNVIRFYKDLFRQSKRGAAIPHLNKEVFNNLLIGLPPMKEQLRIVKQFEKLSDTLK